MNCPGRTTPVEEDGHNQNPSSLSSELTTRSDLGRIANARQRRQHFLRDSRDDPNSEKLPPETVRHDSVDDLIASGRSARRDAVEEPGVHAEGVSEEACSISAHLTEAGSPSDRPSTTILRSWPSKALKVLRRYCNFVGPGFLISVAYIDPGNYATDIAAGASYRFRLLFIILLSNIFAIILQSLCIHLGTVTGLNLAEMIRHHTPKWFNLIWYFFGEAAIIATDMAEVIGTAIALYLLSNGKIPIVAGCAISIADVLFILLFYRPSGSTKAMRIFEGGVALLVLGVVICFCIQLSYIKDTTVGEVFRGYLPSHDLVQGKALYQACGILGATVMPHSLYLGSGLVQERLKEFDRENALLQPEQMAAIEDDDSSKAEPYRPSLRAIRSCRGYSIADCAISLLTFALFVNSAILIIAGASLSNIKGASHASLFGIYHLLSDSLAHAAAIVFAIALLLSGLSAGIVCTIAGQIISEGQLQLKMKPWVQRLMTRSISIVPSIIVAGALGKAGLTKALVGSQVALSILLPFLSAPLIYFTCLGKYMTVGADRVHDLSVQRGVVDGQDTHSGTQDTEAAEQRSVNMRMHWGLTVVAVLIWLVIVLMNGAGIVLLAMGKG